MRIKQIEISSLFGIFNHTIALKMIDHITIVHGPNGLGKTVLLKMVDGIFNSRYGLLRTIPFKKLRIQFDDESSLEVERIAEPESKRRRPSSVKIQFCLIREGEERKYYKPSLQETTQGMSAADAVDRFIPYMSRIGPDLFRNYETQEILSTEEVIEKYSSSFPGLFNVGPEEAWFSELKKNITVHLINTERLAPLTLSGKEQKAARPQKEGHLSVVRYSNDIATKIQEKLAESAALTQALDRTFPARLVQQGTDSPMSADQVRNKLSQLEEKRVQLKDVGLLDKAEDMQFQVPSQMDPATKGVLAVYVQDVESKLGVFDDLAARITLFQKMINDRFLYKKMSISKERGFVITSSDKTNLSPSDLSSGEQHELVLLYELLFRVRKNSLIMIDEPELSLHVAWQEQFLKDLQSITELTAFDVLIATHSPQIIHDRWDLTIELSGPRK